MRERPLVALTTTIDARAGSHQRPAVFLYTSYIHAVERAGLAPVLLTPAHSPAAIEAIIGACSGLVLSGGEDVDPSRYGEAPSPALGSVVPERDELEWRALDAALARDVAILGICRGCQVLNVFLGGTLYQDLPSERPGEISHQQHEPWGRRAHTVAIDRDSRLHAMVGCDTIFINSFHHQGVKQLAPGLRASAYADDGLIEAVEAPGDRWLVGVQWHPERGEASAEEGDPDLRIMAAFRDAVSAHAG